jgi:membrane-anchored mycosin MYCP
MAARTFGDRTTSVPLVWFRSFSAGVAAVALLVVMASPAAAAPRPRRDEWWFSAWGVQTDVWPVTKGAGVIVGVPDSGVNASLPELSGAVLKGGDTTGGKTDGRQDLDDKDSQGTGIAALIAGQGGGKTRFTGIAPEAKILPVRIKPRPDDSAGFNLRKAYADGIRFAVDHNAKVINLSLSFHPDDPHNSCYPDIQNAIAYAIRHDAVVVAGTGDDGDTANQVLQPAGCAGVLAVGAIETTLRPWVKTARRSYVAVAAPGAGGGMVGGSGQYFPQAWGTNIATALTSGAIALIRSRNPHMSGRTVVQRLIATARHTGSSPWNNQTGYGPIQITSAMNPRRYPVPANAPNPVYAAFDKWQAPHTTAQRPNRKPSHSGRRHSSALPVILSSAAALVIVAVTGFLLARRKV